MLFDDRVTGAASFQATLFDGVGLKELVELLGVAPAAAEVVVVDNASGCIADCGEIPGRELNFPTGRLRIEEPCGIKRRFRKRKSRRRSANCCGVADLRFDLDNVGQLLSPL